MSWMRSLLAALVLACWAQIAGACAEAQPAQPQPNMQMPMSAPCEQTAMRHELPTCECPHTMVGLRAAPSEPEKLISLSNASTDASLSIARRPQVHGLAVSEIAEVPRSHSLYLITSRLRL